MFEALNTEMLMTCGILGASALALVGGLVIMRGPRVATQTVDIEKAVKNAPYHRLHNVLPPQNS